MPWATAPFIDYLNAVDAILERRYGVTSSDTGVTRIASCQEDGSTPEACAEEIAGKYELVEIPTVNKEEHANANRELRARRLSRPVHRERRRGAGRSRSEGRR